MSFVWPWFLAMLPLPAIVAILRRRKVSGLRVPSLELWEHAGIGRGRYLWIPPVLRVAALTLMIVSLARPQAGSTYTAQVSEGIAIELLVDVSSSMGMDMQLPSLKNETRQKHESRMEVARKLVERFIAGDGDQLDGREGDLLGLVTFARYADTRSPLTLGHGALLQLVKSLEIQERPNEDGTAYGDAIAVAAARLKQLDDPEIRERNSLAGEVTSRVIILLTDGENNSGQHLPEEAAGLARQWGCRIYCISLGDHQNSAPEAAQLTESERMLEHISLETGGLFRTAYDFDSLLAVYAEVDQLERSKIVTKQYSRVAEWFWFPLALSIAIFIPALLLEATWLRTVS